MSAIPCNGGSFVSFFTCTYVKEEESKKAKTGTSENQRGNFYWRYRTSKDDRECQYYVRIINMDDS